MSAHWTEGGCKMNSKEGGVHWSFWIIGAVSLLWNVMGCINFFMQMNPESVANYPDAARSLIESRPLWATVGFAIAVSGGTLGCLLLLLKKPIACNFLVASLVGVILADIHTFTTDSSTQIWAVSLMSLVLAGFLVWYCTRAEKRGWIT